MNDCHKEITGQKPATANVVWGEVVESLEEKDDPLQYLRSDSDCNVNVQDHGSLHQ